MNNEFERLEESTHIIDEKKYQQIQAELSGDPFEYQRKLYEELKAEDPTLPCIRCGDQIYNNETCPVCGLGSLEREIALIEQPENQGFPFLVPEEYLNKTFNVKVLEGDLQPLDDNKKNYLRLLEKLLNDITVGKIPIMSLFIHAPAGHGKMTFTSTMLKIAHNQGLKVVPYLDMLEISRIMKVFDTHGSQALTSKRLDPIAQNLEISDIDIYEADLCIVKIPNGHEMYSSWRPMLQLIDRRSRRGRSTIIMSRYPLKALLGSDTFNEVESLITYNNPTAKNLQVYGI